MGNILTNTVKNSEIVKTIHPTSLNGHCVTFSSYENYCNIDVNVDIPKYGYSIDFFKNYTAEIYVFRFGEDTIPDYLQMTAEKNEYDYFTGRIFEISEEKYGNARIYITDFTARFAYKDEPYVVPEIDSTNILNIQTELLKAHYPEIRLNDILIIRIKKTK